MTGSPQIPSLPFDQPHPLELPPVLRRLREQGPVHRVRTAVGDDAWLVTEYAAVKSLLGDDRLGLSHPDPDHAARVSNSALFGGRPMGNYDTEHADRAKFRGLLQPFFTAKRMRALQPRVDALVSDLLDELAKQDTPADLHQTLAVPLPVLVICELLGVPYEDRDEFRQYSHAISTLSDGQTSQKGMADLFGYMRKLVAAKRSTPEDDVISGLCAAEGLDDDAVAGLSAMMLFAGHETTVTQIGYAAVMLLSDPDAHGTLLEDPGQMSTAVEECLRYRGSGSGGLMRYPRVDIEVDGVTIPAGDLVLLDTSAANHDPAIFDDPHHFDFTRHGAGQHLAFSHGGHYCIGAPLARIELRSVFAALLPRFPTMRLAVPVTELPVRRDQLTGGFATIPVTW